MQSEDVPSQQNGAGGHQNSHRQEAHVSPFHLHTGRQAFPGHCSRGLPRWLSAHRPSGAGAGLAPATLPGPAFVCSLPAACGPAHALPADTGKKIPWCKNKHGSPTCFYTRGSPVRSFCSLQCWGLGEGGTVEFIHPAGIWDVATPGSSEREKLPQDFLGERSDSYGFPGGREKCGVCGVRGFPRGREPGGT